ncbi:g4217 [Coccomyxa elongata]
MHSLGSQELPEKDTLKQSEKTAPKTKSVPYASLAVPLDAYQLSTIPSGSWSDPQSQTQKRCQSPTSRSEADGMKRKREGVENHHDDHKIWRAY